MTFVQQKHCPLACEFIFRTVRVRNVLNGNFGQSSRCRCQCSDASLFCVQTDCQKARRWFSIVLSYGKRNPNVPVPVAAYVIPRVNVSQYLSGKRGTADEQSYVFQCIYRVLFSLFKKPRFAALESRKTFLSHRKAKRQVFPTRRSLVPHA